MSYTGPDRRRYIVLVCEQLEFHLRDQRCVAAKDRHLDRWLPDHPAVGSKILTGDPKALTLGDSVRFSKDSTQYRVTALERPSHYKGGIVK